MGRPTKIARMDPEVRDVIPRMRSRGRTLDEIRSTLGAHGEVISRSALARHVKLLDAAREAGVVLPAEASTLHASIERLAAQLADLSCAVSGVADLHRQTLARTDEILARLA